MEYNYEKMEAELKEISEKMKGLSNIDKLRELGEKKSWLESKLKARDLLNKAVNKK